MALVKCHECGAEISDEAKKCLRCGARSRAYNQRQLRKAAKIIFIPPLLLIILLGVFLSGNPGSRPPLPLDPVRAAEKEEYENMRAVMLCRDSVTANLRDPDSAKFDTSTPATRLKDGAVILNITLRARSGFGGMTNAEYFCHIKKNGSGIWEITKLIQKE
ncbi:MAG: zinc ribbon domain-containing protein [Alphaproteobacteria bacterium]|nr:zinc ribbon domain-containing protein [Alphaproteobacteria bacterium]